MKSNWIHTFITHRSAADRLDCIAQAVAKKDFIAIETYLDLEYLDPTSTELAKALTLVTHPDALALEAFLYYKMLDADQNIAVAALETWVERTAHTLQANVVELATSSHVTQRFLYRVISHADQFGGAEVLNAVLKRPDIMEWSAAFLGMLLYKCAESGIQVNGLETIANKIVEQIDDWERSSDKALPFLIYYFARYAPEKLEPLAQHRALEMTAWPEIIAASAHIQPRKRSGAASTKKKNAGSAASPKLPAQDQLPGLRQTALGSLYRATSNQLTLDKDPFAEFKNWIAMLKNVDPKKDSLDEIAKTARQQPALMQRPYLKTLGRFSGDDRAVLKLLDSIRTDDETELRLVIEALCGVASPRANMELISIMTRPNVTGAQRVEIARHLVRVDLSSLQNELRSCVHDLQSRPRHEEHDEEVLEILAGLLTAAPVTTIRPHNTESVDMWLLGRIGQFDSLSSEVKRALRTARVFHEQVVPLAATATIDLSPVIEMQYKALELLFREYFELSCKAVIDDGTIQRKLDVIGYARPIESAMNQFESYIESQPVIREIPFFSRFKLRKLLRALCLYRPGKRFTLDGIKAFAMFFLCFSRQEDRYGLAQIMPLNFKNDMELFEFVQMLHRFQDARNRAAHEGFHPDASHNVEAIWMETAYIIQMAHHLKQGLEHAPAPSSHHHNRSAPGPAHGSHKATIIVRKKAS